MIHVLKTWPEVFGAMLREAKRFEYRKNDRDFKIDDVLELREYEPDTCTYTGEVIHRKIQYIVYGGVFGIPEDYCIMDVRPATKAECISVE